MNPIPSTNNMLPSDLEGRQLWIFGGAGYLGRAVVGGLAARGARVLCADLPGRAASFVTDAGLSQQVTAVDCDLSEAEDLESLVGALCASHGIPEGMANMTFGSTISALADLTPGEFDRANRINLTAGFFLARAVADRMAEQGRGSIVLFSSMYGTVAPDPACYPSGIHPNPVEYGVGKSGVQQMARYLAMHYGCKGVRCNSLSPGPFTNPEARLRFEAHTRSIERKTVLGRIGEAHEIVGPVGFLLSDASSYVTGHNLAVDAGWTAW